eukprot:1075269-Ditylum_brightwellii.AAC.1
MDVKQMFVPAPGESIVSIPGIKLDTFYSPLMKGISSPFYISPYSISLEMPRSENNKESAFFQVGSTDEELEIKGLCIPALTKEVPEYTKRVTHFINAKLKAIHTDQYIKRVLTLEAILEVSQYNYNLKTHKITPKDVEMPD